MAPFFWAIALAPVAPSAAQPSVDPASAIEIIGMAPPEIRREATEYVQRLGIANGSKPAGRWIDSICPHAIGLETAQETIVEQQVRSIAQSVGAPLGKDKCDPNLLIVFTDDPKGVVKAVFRKLQLTSDSVGDRKALETGDQPVRWWYSSEFRNRDGAEGSALPPALKVETQDPGGPGITEGGLHSNDHSTSITQSGASLISTQLKRAITHATVVVDVRGATGKSLKSVVDYASLVGLAEVRLGASAPNSILNLFSPDQKPVELTVTDQAFLRTLYAMSLDRKADQHRRILIGQIIRERTGKN